MAIKLKLAALMAAEPALQRVMATRLPATSAYRMSRLLAKVQSEAKAFRDAQTKLIMQWGVEDPPGTKRFEIKDPEKLKQFGEELQRLGDEEVVIDRDPIPIEMFGEAQLAPADLALLEAFISGED